MALKELHVNRAYLKYTLLLMFVGLFTSSNAQTAGDINAFTRFVNKTYRLPDTLKSNCEWMYAIVKVSTDSHNKIIDYTFVNKPLEAMKPSFSFLVGYQFSRKMKINGRPIVFYLAIDNLEGCTEKPGDKMFYAPNTAASEVWAYITKLVKNNPNTIFISNILIHGYGKPQQ